LIRRFDYKIKNDLLINGKNEIAPTNIRAELFAIILALYLVKTYNGAKTIEIITDSEFSINVCTKWITNWQVNKFNGKKTLIY
jgi:ribonuclease HI